MPGVISGEALLVSHGYTPEFVRYGVTTRGYYARIVACAKQDLLEQQAHTIGIMVGIGSLFDKNGAKTLEQRVKEGLKAFDTQMNEIFEESAPAAASESLNVTAHTPAAAGPRAPERRPAPTVQQQQKIVRQLDAIMSQLTGQRHMNPIGGYNHSNSFTQFDVTGTPIRDLLQRVEQ